MRLSPLVNNITERGVGAVVKALRNNHCIEELNLESMYKFFARDIIIAWFTPLKSHACSFQVFMRWGMASDFSIFVSLKGFSQNLTFMSSVHDMFHLISHFSQVFIRKHQPNSSCTWNTRTEYVSMHLLMVFIKQFIDFSFW